MKYILFLLLILMMPQANAQDYTGSVGFRGGQTWGLDMKVFPSEQTAVEGIFSFRDKGVQLTLLIEKYYPLLLQNSDNLYAFVGYGGHLGYTKWYEETYDGSNPATPYYYEYKASPVIGADVIAGVEYRLYSSPFAFCLDFKPFIELFGEDFFRINFSDFGLTARYTFK